MRQAVPIGTAAKKSGVKVPTIRFYEQIGLLCQRRSNSGPLRRSKSGPGLAGVAA
ncbi:MAG TPA: MerR family DNA-binding transcriptional regulator [Mesorhizobium sp.]|jgi:DNA-binding transcriptional MerR regulator|nr:MerR family DNA-binding transcriptional regulator [Mesorhizobium sp.]